MAETRLYKRLSSRRPTKKVNCVLAIHQERQSYQVAKNAARQRMQETQEDQIRHRLNDRRFGLARF